MKRIHYAAAALALAALIALPAAAATGSAKDTTTPTPATVTVSGSGTVTDTPQISAWTFGVSGRGDTASAAFSAVSATMTKVIAALKSAGIPSADLQTQQVSLSSVQSQDGTRTIGYQASNSVAATVRDNGRIGAVVDAAVGAGAVDVNGPSFSSAGGDALYRKALAAAVDDATAKAQVIAARLGRTLGRVTSVAEQSGGPIVFAGGAAKPSTTAVPVEPGQTQTIATVTATFELS